MGISFTLEQITEGTIINEPEGIATFDWVDSNGNTLNIETHLPDGSISVIAYDKVGYDFSKMYYQDEVEQMITDINEFFNS